MTLVEAIRIRVVALAVALLACGLWPSASVAQAPLPAAPDVRIAVEGAYPPFNFLDQAGELQGFEPELAKTLCAAAHLRCTLVVREWDGMIRGLINREYDAIMSSLEITRKRQKRIAFSRPYYRVPSAFIGKQDAETRETSPAALAGLRIGVVDRSPQAAFLKELYTESEIVPFAKIEEANLDLLMDRLDLVLGDKLALARFLESREGACCKFVGDAPQDPAYFDPGVGIGFRKEDTELVEAFDRAIGQVLTDGTYDEIRKRHFSIDLRP
jgi:polar amino acid transport system substrate-binding protein